MIKSIDKTKYVFVMALLLLTMHIAAAQQLSIEEAWRLGRENYPAIKKYNLIKAVNDYTLQNAAKAYLPQFSANAQATWQTEVTRIPVAVPGIKEMNKDQYRIQAEANQLIYDGGAVKAQQALQSANTAVQLQSIEVAMHTIKERITEIYFGILLMDEQLAQQKLRTEVLESTLKKAEAALANGVSYRSNVQELKAELLNAQMAVHEIKTDQRGYKDMLAKLLGTTIHEETIFVKPATVNVPGEINRAELKLYDLQKTVYDTQKKKLQSDWLPKISAFVQGGYGRPGLNMLDNNFAPYAIGGVRLSFPVSNLYTRENNLKIIELNKQQLEADREAFILNTDINLQKQASEIEKYESLIREDDKIIELRKSVTASAQAQLDNKVITVTEFITKLNAEYAARQTKYLHQLQLLKAKYNYNNTSGN
ncbi:TolC family protein [Haoranjiania flava]|uniref:TolC family protein n=1 Tax=Haoranjiania flava TaxID=1856322 RepID=A0AAE3LKM2_9BACT|nr:TolC family protein [Haoranjiania flava]MCU7694723.1 TolC family protein [Haoranjiania flava]